MREGTSLGFRAVVSLFADQTRHHPLRARLYVEHAATTVTIVYYEHAFVVYGLPDGPPVVAVSGKDVFFDVREMSHTRRHRLRTEDQSIPANRAFYALYHLWDPRSLARGIKAGTERKRHPGLSAVEIDLREALPLESQVIRRLGGRSTRLDDAFANSDEGHSWTRRIVEYTTADERLTSFAVADFSEAWLTIAIE